MFCSKCGKLVTDDMKFCNSCGEKIELLNKAESIIPTPTENVIIKKSTVKKKVIFIAMAAIVIVGLIIMKFIISPPISGPEVLYDLKWGMTYEQVKAVDSKIRTQEFKQFDNEHGVYLSTIDYNYMRIDSKYGGAAITYHFGVSNSLEKIEIQYGANGEIKYDVIIKKLENYYNAVCKTSPTKGKAAHGNNEILIWNTTNNQISVGGDFDRTDYVTVTITPVNQSSSNGASKEIAAPTTAQQPAYTFDEILAVQPQQYRSGGDAFDVTSQDANYYGEITIREKSHVPTGDINETYALFIVNSTDTKFEGRNTANLKLEFKQDGYVNIAAAYGTKNGNIVEYPFNQAFANSPNDYENTGGYTWLNLCDLSYNNVFWNTQQNIMQNNASFRILSCTITKEEAIRYVQDGTLPNCLQGLTVIGLDNILRKSVQ